MSLSDSSEPNDSVVRRTFTLELIRSIAIGVLETSMATFAILIAVKQFQMGPSLKAMILGSQALGLIGSLFVVPLVYRFRFRINRAAAFIGLIAGVGFAIAVVSKESQLGFVVGMAIGLCFMVLGLPLHTQYIRQNYPQASRGRLFAIAIVVRSITAIVFSYIGGQWLEADMSLFTTLLGCFVVASLISSICVWLIPVSESCDADEELRTTSVKDSMRWLEKDPVFCRVIVSAMAMGLGVLMANSLRVDYLANDEHGLSFDIATITLITGIIPSVARLFSTFFWGWLFDRMNFFRLRVVVNFVFLIGILFYFLPSSVELIMVGTACFGLARGGGEILWNLGVTKLARREHVAEYMSVHTFMTGLRSLIAPFIGFYLVAFTSITTLVGTSTCFVILATITLLPLLKRTDEQKRNTR